MSEAHVVNIRENLRRCPHCDHFRELILRISYEEKWDGDEVLEGFKVWRILECPACERPILEEEVFVDGDIYPDKKVLYPTAKEALTGLPFSIKLEYAEVLKLQLISNYACASAIRRTLEAICKHEKAEGKNLFEKIKDLAKKNRIPQQLADMADVTRQLGNIGAHSNEHDSAISNSDLITVIDFIEAIIEYLYIAPHKVKALKNKLSGKKNPLVEEGTSDDIHTF